jgi:hypothetical protein
MGASLGSIRAGPKHQRPRYLVEGCGGAQNRRISILISLPPAGKPPCGSHGNLTLPSLGCDELGVSLDVEPLYSKLGGDVQAIH